MLAPGYDYVGVGGPQPAREFRIVTPEEESAMEVLTQEAYHSEFLDDPEKCEVFVPIRGIETKTLFPTRTCTQSPRTTGRTFWPKT